MKVMFFTWLICRAHIHAIDHLADAFLEALRLPFESGEGVIEVLRQHIAVGHGLLDGVAADGFGCLDRGIVLVGGRFQIAAPDIGGNLVDGDAGIHGPGLDRANHALDDQGHDVAAIGVIEGRILNRLEKGQKPVQGGRASVQQRLNLVMKVGVANLPHVDGSVDGGRDHYIVGSVDPGIGLCGVEQRLDHHQKAPPVGGAGRRLEVDAGIVNHLGQRVVELAQLLVVLRANMEPDHVQIDQLSKAAQ